MEFPVDFKFGEGNKLYRCPVPDEPLPEKKLPATPVAAIYVPFLSREIPYP